MGTQTERKPLGIVESLTAGFDAVTRAPQVMIVPILLDLFLWLGPRLSAYPLIKSVLAFMRSMPPAPDEVTRLQIAQAQALLDQTGQQFNMFAWLSPFLMGVPSLMVNLLSDKQPWAQPASVWEVDNVLVYLVLFGLFSLLGIGLSALYWSQIARLALGGWPAGRGWLAHAAHIGWGLLKLVVMLSVLGLMIVVPVTMAAAVVALFSPALGQLVMVVGLMLLVWIVVYMAFVIHGVALREGTFVEAVRSSAHLMRTQFLPAGGMLLLGAIIYWGLGLVWTIPAGDAWLRAGAIFGNAFVASGVLCATAFFYLARVQVKTTGERPANK